MQASSVNLLTFVLLFFSSPFIGYNELLHSSEAYIFNTIVQLTKLCLVLFDAAHFGVTLTTMLPLLKIKVLFYPCKRNLLDNRFIPKSNDFSVIYNYAFHNNNKALCLIMITNCY